MTTEPTPAPTAPPVVPAPVVVPQFTQEQLTAHATREAAEARRQALREVAEKLNMTVDEAEQVLKDRAEADAARLSDLEKRERAIATREQKTAETEQTLKQLEHKHRIREALLNNGVKPERLQFAHVDVAPDADDATLAAAVAAYKASVPEWFHEVTSDTPTPPPPGTPTPSSDPGKAPTPSGKPSEDAYNRGAERAKTYQSTGVQIG